MGSEEVGFVIRGREDIALACGRRGVKAFYKLKEQGLPVYKPSGARDWEVRPEDVREFLKARRDAALKS